MHTFPVTVLFVPARSPGQAWSEVIQTAEALEEALQFAADGNIDATIQED